MSAIMRRNWSGDMVLVTLTRRAPPSAGAASAGPLWCDAVPGSVRGAVEAACVVTAPIPLTWDDAVGLSSSVIGVPASERAWGAVG